MPNRILIIDDDKDLCRLLQESLRQMDAEADVCYSGNVGISFMQKSFGCLQGGRHAGRDRGCLRLRIPGLH